MAKDYEGYRCAECEDALANVTPDDGPPKQCPFCGALFHGDCMDGHHCDEMEREGQSKLQAWEAATQGWARG